MSGATPAHVSRRRLLALAVGVAAAVLLVLAIVPLWPWRPACRCYTQWTGDLRDVYVDYVAINLDRNEISYWRFGDIILIRFLPWLDGRQISTRSDAIFNIECKVAEMLSEDVTLDGVLHRAPEIVDRLRVEMAAQIGPDPRFAPDGTRRIAADTRVSQICPLFRATILEPQPVGSPN